MPNPSSPQEPAVPGSAHTKIQSVEIRNTKGGSIQLFFEEGFLYSMVGSTFTAQDPEDTAATVTLEADSFRVTDATIQLVRRKGRAT